jgi:hypothetical protein
MKFLSFVGATEHIQETHRNKQIIIECDIDM